MTRSKKFCCGYPLSKEGVCQRERFESQKPNKSLDFMQIHSQKQKRKDGL